MRSVNMTEARRRLAGLVDAASAGAVIQITRRGKPVSTLRPAGDHVRRAKPGALQHAVARVKRLMRQVPSGLPRASRALAAERYRRTRA
jgi:prevent-host-death family protein